MHIDREDMLELTRRMTVSATVFPELSGAYMDEEGFIDGTFNTQFSEVVRKRKEKNLNIAKTVPYSNTNVNLEKLPTGSGSPETGQHYAVIGGITAVRTEK